MNNKSLSQDLGQKKAWYTRFLSLQGCIKSHYAGCPAYSILSWQPEIHTTGVYCDGIGKSQENNPSSRSSVFFWGQLQTLLPSGMDPGMKQNKKDGTGIAQPRILAQGRWCEHSTGKVCRLRGLHDADRISC